MGSIGPGGSFQQPFGPFSRQPQGSPFADQTDAGPTFQPQPGLPFTLTPQQAQAAIMLGQMLLAPLASHVNMLDAAQFSLFLKNLLQLPRDIQQLLLMLGTGEQAEVLKTLKELLQQNPEATIPLDALQALLKQATKDGEGKLLQLLKSSQVNYTGGSKSMGDMLSMLSQLSTRVASSPTEALHTTLLLYLPWYPLAVNQKLTLYFEKSDSDSTGEDDENKGQGGSEEDAHMVLLVETNTLGRFKIVTIPLGQTRLLFDVSHDATAIPFLKSLSAKLATTLTGAGLQAPDISFKQRGMRTSVFTQPQTPTSTSGNQAASLPDQATKQTEDKQSLVVHSVGQVPVAVVQGAYWLARLIFEQDQQKTLETDREAQLNQQLNQPPQHKKPGPQL